MALRRSLSLLLFSTVVVACGGGLGGGSDWIKQPLSPEDERASMQTETNGPRGQPGARTIGNRPINDKDKDRDGRSIDLSGGGGKVLGTFRNTYYDFPSEADHAAASSSNAKSAGNGSSSTVSLMNASCQPIAQVPRTFYEAVCVQGSGSLAKGGTVSFAKRDCACAEICPRTQQKICFDALDKQAFPWGRGAAGIPITPLRTVAADTKVLPMGTVLYIPELDGIERAVGDGSVKAPIDGCFIVEDRGVRVQGEHVDIFTGQPSQTTALNQQVPSNQGVTIVLDAPKCAHLAKR